MQLKSSKDTRSSLLSFAATFVALIAGFWLGDFLFPEGMSFGEPLSDRIGHAFELGSYPLSFLATALVLSFSLLVVDLFPPGRAGQIVLCVIGLLGGAYYYDFTAENRIEDAYTSVLSALPHQVTDAVFLSSLVWPHLILVFVKLSLRSTRGVAERPV